MKRLTVGAALVAVGALALSACSGTGQDEGPESADNLDLNYAVITHSGTRETPSGTGSSRAPSAPATTTASTWSTPPTRIRPSSRS